MPSPSCSDAATAGLAVPAQPLTVGMGWRHAHYEAVLAERPPLAFLEVHSENFFGDGGAALAVLQAGRAAYPLSLHGVGLSLGSACGLDAWHLDRLAQLVERTDPVRVSDHVCFARVPWAQGLGRALAQAPTAPAAARAATVEAVHAADLLPLPLTHEALALMVRHVQQVQDRLRRPLVVEHLSAYLQWARADWSEPDFLTELSRRSGCHLLVDVNNLLVNAQNAHGIRQPDDPRVGTHALPDACAWLDALGADVPVAELHLAGHAHTDTLVIDDHGRPVCDAVWALYRHALRRWGAVPTAIEWDTDVPELPVLLAEVARAADAARAVQAQGADHTQGAPRAGNAPTALNVPNVPNVPNVLDAPANRFTAPLAAPQPAAPQGATPLLAQEQALVQALWAPPGPQALAQAVATIHPFFEAINPIGTCAEGLKTYKNNAHALAQRALPAAYPVLAVLMGEDSLAALARALWHHHPPACGDLAHWGGALAGFMRASDQLADWPWLAEVARLEWALHRAETAADAPDHPASLALLAQADPAALTLQLAAGTQVLGLDHAVAEVVQAGGQWPNGPAAPPAQAQWVAVWRPQGKAQAEVLSPELAGFLQALQQGHSLLAALDAHPIDLPQWLPLAVQRGWVVGVRSLNRLSCAS